MPDGKQLPTSSVRTSNSKGRAFLMQLSEIYTAESRLGRNATTFKTNETTDKIHCKIVCLRKRNLTVTSGILNE